MYTLMTGCTGVVGVALREIFEKSEETVFYLIRDGKSRLEKGDVNVTDIDLWQIINGDLEANVCGVDNSEIKLLSGKIEKIVHVAGSVKFDEILRDEIFHTNVEGTKNVLELAKRIGVKEFHFVSTAYAETQRNAYEESKYKAEKLVKESGIPFSIYRIGIVVGDSTTGDITDYTGFYGFFAGLHSLAEKQRERVNEIVDIPIFIDCSFTSTLNLVPRDWLTETMYKLIQLESTGETFYVTHPNPMLVNDVMKFGFKELGISGIKYNNYLSEQPVQTKREFRVVQRGVNKTLARYKPYVTEEKHFPLDSTRTALGRSFRDPPNVTKEMLSIFLRFAIKNNFGREKESLVEKTFLVNA